MKLIISSLIVVFLTSASFASQAKVMDGKMVFAKYDYCGSPVWNDDEKNFILNNVSTATASDFVVIAIDADTFEIANEISDTHKISSFSDFNKEITRRKSKEYNIEKIVEIQAKIDALTKLRTVDTSIDINTEIADYRAILNKHKERYKKML